VTDTQLKVRALGRFEWEKIVRRIVLPSKRRAVKTVAMVLASYADADGTNVRPGEKRLADVCQFGRSTVRESLGWLRDNHLIYRNSRGSNFGKANLVDVYQLCAPEDWEDRFMLLSAAEYDEDDMIVRPVRFNNNPSIDFY
jgi:hypothetical protein